jgi:hypothetical protein
MGVLFARLSAEFSGFDAIALLDAIKNSAHYNKHGKVKYYKIACETLRSRVHECTDEPFRVYLLPILGDKDQMMKTKY